MREIVTNLRSQPCVMLSLYPVLFIADDLVRVSVCGRAAGADRPRLAKTTPKPRSRIWWTICPVLRESTTEFQCRRRAAWRAVFCLSGAPDARRKSAKNESEDEFKKRKEKRPIQDRTHDSGSPGRARTYNPSVNSRECSAIELLRNISFKNGMIIPPSAESVNPFYTFFLRERRLLSARIARFGMAAFHLRVL